jgi:MYXO-CTERM domain-containing protein
VGWLDWRVFAVGTVLLLEPRAAEACSWTAWVDVLRPADGDVHPEGAGLLFLAIDGQPVELFAVTVDGEPASLVTELEHTSGVLGRYSVVWIEPMPLEGQVVVVSRCGAPDALEHLSCPPDSPFFEVLEFTVGPPDDTAPPVAGNVSLSHQLGTFEYFCWTDGEFRFDVSATALDPGDEEDLVYVVEIRDPHGEVVTEEAIYDEEPPQELFVDEVLLDAPPDAAEYCASVTALDLSGNATVVADACGSIEIPSEGGSSSSDGGSEPTTTGEPETTTTEGPGVDASTGAATSGETPQSTGEDGSPADGVVDRGCACRSSSAPPSWWMMLLVALVSRRPRR